MVLDVFGGCQWRPLRFPWWDVDSDLPYRMDGKELLLVLWLVLLCGIPRNGMDGDDTEEDL